MTDKQLIIFTFHFLWSIGEDKLDCRIWRKPVIYRETSTKAMTKISRLSPTQQRDCDEEQSEESAICEVETPKLINKDTCL